MITHGTPIAASLLSRLNRPDTMWASAPAPEIASTPLAASAVLRRAGAPTCSTLKLASAVTLAISRLTAGPLLVRTVIAPSVTSAAATVSAAASSAPACSIVRLSMLERAAPSYRCTPAHAPAALLAPVIVTGASAVPLTSRRADLLP